MVKGDRDVTQAHINQMPYLKAFVRETFRVWPNGTEVSRYTEKDMVSSTCTRLILWGRARGFSRTALAILLASTGLRFGL